MASLHGLTVVHIEGIGRMGSKTDEEPTKTERVWRSRVSGLTERRSSGLVDVISHAIKLLITDIS